MVLLARGGLGLGYTPAQNIVHGSVIAQPCAPTLAASAPVVHFLFLKKRLGSACAEAAFAITLTFAIFLPAN